MGWHVAFQEKPQTRNDFGSFYPRANVGYAHVLLRQKLIRRLKAAYSDVPSDRYTVDSFHHPSSGDRLNTIRPRGGHFLRGDIAAFDAPFFNCTTSEAKAMDPQSRLMLEVAYEAFENGGLPMESLAGSNTSCFVGCFTRDYHEMTVRDAEAAEVYTVTGLGFSLLSNRVSWFFDLKGPSVTLDTACSSSMVGFHLACQSLRTGESNTGIVCGANLIFGPDLPMWMSNLNMLSKDGLSKAFDASADGYGRGEGIACVVIKRLDDALNDGNTIRAVVRATGTNQDGRTTGITVPSTDAQAELIRSTYASAGLDYSKTRYFEAHVSYVCTFGSLY